MNTFTYSLNEYLLCIYYILGTILGIGDTTVKNTDKAPALMECILDKEMENKQTEMLSIRWYKS